MSVINRTTASHETLRHLGLEESGSCFLCGEFIAGLIVYWNGRGADLSLHPKCAVHLGVDLIKDGRSAELEARRGLTA